MKLSRAAVFAVACSALAFGCADQRDIGDDTQEIIDNLTEAGFPSSEITVVEGTVYVGRDAAVSLEASREMLRVDGSTTKEQYHTTNLVSRSVHRICVFARPCTVHSAKFATAITNAIANYTNLGLTFNMFDRDPRTDECDARITCQLASGVAGGSSGFPSGGLPFGVIRIGTALDAARFSTDTVEHVMTHELGHTIGLRHSDWFDRSISCGIGGSEDANSVGAILISGTPSGATEGGSLMNACFRTSETGEFTSSDVTALNALYGL